MKQWKRLLCVLLAVMSSRMLYAQEFLHLNYDCGVPRIAFAQVHMIDKRNEGQLLGFVQKGAFNRETPIAFEGSLGDSLVHYFQQGNAAVHSDKKLVCMLEEFFLSEQTGAMSEQGRTKMSFRFFVSDGDKDNYHELLTLDTTFINKGLDVTQKMLRNVSEHYCAIANSLDRPVVSDLAGYTLEDLYQLDSIEMVRVPAFTEAPKAGIYKTYESFRTNRPDLPREIYIEPKYAGDVAVYQVWEKKSGAKKNVRLMGGAYAVSDGKQVVRLYNDHFYTLYKAAFGFYFECPAVFNNNAAMWGSAIGGIAGGAIAGSIQRHNMKVYQFRINPRTGKATPVVVVYDPKEDR